MEQPRSLAPLLMLCPNTHSFPIVPKRVLPHQLHHSLVSGPCLTSSSVLQPSDYSFLFPIADLAQAWGRLELDIHVLWHLTVEPGGSCLQFSCQSSNAINKQLHGSKLFALPSLGTKRVLIGRWQSCRSLSTGSWSREHPVLQLGPEM